MGFQRSKKEMMKLLLKLACRFRFYSNLFNGNKGYIQWHRFPEGHGLPELVTQVPDISFQVDDLDARIKGCKILFGPYRPLEGYRVAMI
jgi:hypothetical protein